MCSAKTRRHSIRYSLGKQKSDNLRSGASCIPSTGGRVTFWPVGTMHVNTTPACEALVPSSGPVSGCSGEEITEPKVLSPCTCVTSPGPDAQQCCSVRVIGKHEHIHLHASPWKGVLSTRASGGRTRGGLLKSYSRALLVGLVVRTSFSTAAIPPAVPRWTPSCTQRHRPWSRAGVGGRGVVRTAILPAGAWSPKPG